MQVLACLVLVVLVTVGAHVALRVVGLDLGPVLGGAGIVGIALALAPRDTAVRRPDGARVLLPDGKVLDALANLPEIHDGPPPEAWVEELARW